MVVFWWGFSRNILKVLLPNALNWSPEAFQKNVTGIRSQCLLDSELFLWVIWYLINSAVSPFLKYKNCNFRTWRNSEEWGWLYAPKMGHWTTMQLSLLIELSSEMLTDQHEELGCYSKKAQSQLCCIALIFRSSTSFLLLSLFLFLNKVSTEKLSC